MAIYEATKLEFFFNLEFSNCEFSHEMFEKLREFGISVFEYEFGPISETQGIDIGGIYFGNASQFNSPRIAVLFMNKSIRGFDSESISELLLRISCRVVDRLEHIMYKLFPELDPDYAQTTY